MNQEREAIVLKNVEKWYRGQRVLLVEELALLEGERVAVTGGNGSGKSTLIRLLAGVTLADRGHVWRAPQLSRGILGLVPQSGGLYGELSVAENLHLRRRLYGLRKQESCAAAFLDELGLAESLAKRFSELSGGYQRLATFATALFLQPTWLLLDEPVAGLDRTKKEKFLAVLSQFDPALQLVVMAAPSAEDLPAASREIVMQEGKISCA